MSWSLNEIETLGKRAARGAGMEWGLAEEAGKATRWLCAAGWPGADLLARLLTRNDGADYHDLCPQGTEGRWKAAGGRLCPLIAGATLCDLAGDWAAGGEADLGPTSCPLLLVPYMAWAADMTGTMLEITWPGVRITRGTGKTHISADDAALTADTAGQVTLRQTARPAETPVTRVYRGEIAPDAAQALTTLAYRTFAPDTEQSRHSGAGAGLTDND